MPVTIDTSLPLHDDRDTSWDGDAASRAMAAACTSRDEQLDVSCMGEGFLWRDPDANETTQGAYKFPVANIFNGNKHIVWSGVTAAASYLERAKGIPDDDMSRMRSALETLYNRFADEFDDDTIVAPWVESGETAAAESPDASSPEDSGRVEDSGCDCDGCVCSGRDEQQPVYDPVIRASASDGDAWSPPRDWFAPQDPAPLTITPDGQVYGDLARFGQRHIGADGANIYPPKDPDGLYRAFRQRTIECDNGERVAVGVLTMDTGHAGMGVSADAAVSHYDNTGAMVAAINVGEDREGPDGSGRIWMAGALLPDVTDEQRLRLMLSGVSGDWRQTRSRGPLELVAALAVNVPGFPVPAVELADGRELAVVAAGAVLPAVPAEQLPHPVNVTIGDELVDRVARRCVEVAEENLAAKQQRDAYAASVVAGLRSGVTKVKARNARALLSAAVKGNGPVTVDGGDE